MGLHLLVLGPEPKTDPGASEDSVLRPRATARSPRGHTPPRGPAPASRARRGSRGGVAPARGAARFRFPKRVNASIVRSLFAVETPPDPQQKLELSVVIPCLNEEKTITFCIEKALRAMKEHDIRGEVVVSDNGSTDGSIAISRAAGARVVACPTPGYGAAVKYGFENAWGDYVLMGDADDSYDFSELPRFIDKVREGHDYVMGTRLRGTIMPGAMPFLNRHLGTPVLTRILNWLFDTRITDCNSGMRCMKRERVLGLGLISPGMEFASELIVKAAKAGVKIVEVPITLHKDKRDRPPHLRPWRDGWRHLRLLLWYAPNKTMTQPGLALLGLGLALVVSQLFGPFTIGGVLFDFHYMILGLTLSQLGLSATSMGVAIYAVMPEPKRHSPLVDWLTFDKGVVLGAALFLGGLACDGYVLAHWLATHRGEITPGLTRLTLAGILLMAMGFQCILAGLLMGSALTAQAGHRARAARGDD